VIELNHSITYRITGLMFLVVTGTVFLLVYLANEQMIGLFQKYLVIQHMGHGKVMMGNMRMDDPLMLKIMGSPEYGFLASVHNTLIWVGGAILSVGLLASYAVARSITIPLRQLADAAEEIEKGKFDLQVKVDNTEDELGHLANAFNRMTEALSASNRLRRRLLADIAHELKTPLAVMQGHLEGMLEGVVTVNKEEIASLHEETTHLNRLINDLRDLSLAESGQLKLNKTATDINQLISRALQMLKPLAEEKEINLECNLKPIPNIMVDAGRMNQIIYNLLTNALRYTPVKGIIEISTSLIKQRGGQWLKMEVKDNGQGISPEDLPYIFHHFYRSDQSRNRKSGGSGIGLAIVKQLVENHGGYVDVQSKVGEGSSFYSYLPVN